MKEIFNLNDKMIELSQKHSHQFSEYKQVKCCFNDLYNHLIISRETLNHYYKFWTEQPVDIHTEKEYDKVLDSREKITIEITKYLFISTISTIEYYIRKVIDTSNNHLLKDYINRSIKGYDEFYKVYKLLEDSEKEKFKDVKKVLKDLPPCDSISRIIQESYSNDIITKDKLNKWEFILTLRNITVHNNCISPKDLSLEIDNRVFELKKGKMLNDKLDVYMYLTNIMIDLFYDWCSHNYKLNI